MAQPLACHASGGAVERSGVRGQTAAKVRVRVRVLGLDSRHDGGAPTLSGAPRSSFKSLQPLKAPYLLRKKHENVQPDWPRYTTINT